VMLCQHHKRKRRTRGEMWRIASGSPSRPASSSSSPALVISQQPCLCFSPISLSPPTSSATPLRPPYQTGHRYPRDLSPGDVLFELNRAAIIKCQSLIVLIEQGIRLTNDLEQIAAVSFDLNCNVMTEEQKRMKVLGGHRSSFHLGRCMRMPSQTLATKENIKGVEMEVMGRVEVGKSSITRHEK
jgi:hypothetical protein